MVRRFQREARAASLLSHPNIVTIYDLGQVEDGTLYLAMELCAGMSLKDLIVAEGPLAPRRASACVAPSRGRSRSPTKTASCIAISSPTM